MPKRCKMITWLLPAALVFAAGFSVAAIWDLDISLLLFSPANDLAAFMEIFGWYPAFLPPVLLCLLYFTAPPQALRFRWLRPAGGLLAAAGFGFLYSMSAHYMQKRHWLPATFGPLTALWLGMGVVFAALCLFVMRQTTARLRPKLAFFLAWASVYTLLGQAVVQPLKLLWQRTRFDDMVAADSFAAFTPWWQPLGNGGSSFPSGHTSQAAALLALVILCDLFISWRRHRVLVYAGSWLYISLMAFCRILIGRHFLSDTLAAAGILALVFMGMRRLPGYREGLARLHPDAQAGAAGFRGDAPPPAPSAAHAGPKPAEPARKQSPEEESTHGL